MFNSPIDSPIVSPLTGPWGHGQSGVPGDPIFLALERDGFEDSIGESSRPVQKKWHLLGDGTGYLANASIVGTETVTSKEGTATVTIAAGRVNVGVGTLWSLALSNGSRYELPSMVGTTAAMMFDVSGNGRHLTLDGYTLATAVVESLFDGSDWLNQYGYTIADGSQYTNVYCLTSIPSGTIIPRQYMSIYSAAWEVTA